MCVKDQSDLDSARIDVVAVLSVVVECAEWCSGGELIKEIIKSLKV